jgi:hypothetical protein
MEKAGEKPINMQLTTQGTGDFQPVIVTITLESLMEVQAFARMTKYSYTIAELVAPDLPTHNAIIVDILKTARQGFLCK